MFFVSTISEVPISVVRSRSEYMLGDGAGRYLVVNQSKTIAYGRYKSRHDAESHAADLNSASEEVILDGFDPEVVAKVCRLIDED